jgi:hypothetical protein
VVSSTAMYRSSMAVGLLLIELTSTVTTPTDDSRPSLTV